MRVLMMPRDTNHLGTIFGGVILSYIDQAGFVEARRHGLHRWVTIAMDNVIFKEPVYVGDIVAFKTKTVQTGTSSVKVEVVVEADRFESGKTVQVTTAGVKMVAVDRNGKSIDFRKESTLDRRYPHGAFV